MLVLLIPYFLFLYNAILPIQIFRQRGKKGFRLDPPPDSTFLIGPFYHPISSLFWMLVQTPLWKAHWVRLRSKISGKFNCVALLPGIAGICFVFLGQTAALLKVSPCLFVSKRNFILSCNECIVLVGCLIDKCIYDLERTTFTRIILA